MIDIESDYSQLLPIRNEVFPTFDADQEQAASVIVARISKHVTQRHIENIVELGCGTAEILDSVRTQLLALNGREMKCLGIDCCAAEIAIARERRSQSDFVEQRAEEFMSSVVDRRDLNPASTLLMCVGHTIPHFHRTAQFLNDLARWGPALVLIDFYQQWDDVVRQFETADAMPERELKRSYRSSDGRLVTHTLTTKRNPDDADRVLRGVETSREDEDGLTNFWTSQLRRESKWFLRELQDRGYDLAETLNYGGGYGPMNGHLLSRRNH